MLSLQEITTIKVLKLLEAEELTKEQTKQIFPIDLSAKLESLMNIQNNCINEVKVAANK